MRNGLHGTTRDHEGGMSMGLVVGLLSGLDNQVKGGHGIISYMKTCSICKETKEFDFFYKWKHNKDGFTSQCKKCHLHLRKLSYQKNIVLRAAQRKKRTGETIEERRNYNLMAKYGITSKDYEALLLSQNGVCKICLKPDIKGKMLVVDHDHITGK